MFYVPCRTNSFSLPGYDVIIIPAPHDRAPVKSLCKATSANNRYRHGASRKLAKSRTIDVASCFANQLGVQPVYMRQYVASVWSERRRLRRIHRKTMQFMIPRGTQILGERSARR